MLGGFILSKNYESFNNSEISIRMSSLIQERIGLVSTHMYKQFLDYQHSTMNTTENIYCNYDKDKSVIILNILWHTISFTTRCNYEPQALYREGNEPMFSGRIMAIAGNYNELMEGVTSRKDIMNILLDKEVASLYIPPDKSQNSIMKIRHLSNREFFLPSTDAAREFVLKVLETICGGGLYHEEGSRKSFNI